MILHIETATEVCSVCLSRGEKVLNLQAPAGANDHLRVITLLIATCLEEAGASLDELDAVAVSAGPGSYTALRVGVSAAKGICFATNKPLVAIDTLQALACAALEQEQDDGALYCPMMDARRMEVYCALFDHKNELVEASSAKVIEEGSFKELLDAGQRIFFMGNGAGKCRETIQSPNAVFLNIACSARHLVHLAVRAFGKGNFADLAYFTPNYLKAPNITKPKEKFFK